MMEAAKRDLREERIEDILFGVETNVRNLCYAMQLVSDQGFVGAPLAEKAERFNSMLDTFIKTIAQWMDPLTQLQQEFDGLAPVTIAALEKSEEFSFRPLPRKAFTSDEAYQHYLDNMIIEPGER